MPEFYKFTIKPTQFEFLKKNINKNCIINLFINLNFIEIGKIGNH